MNETAIILASLGTFLLTIWKILRYLFSSLAKENKEYRDSLNQEYKNLNSKFDELTDDYTKLNVRLQKAEFENKTLKTEVTRLTSRINDLTKTNGELKLAEKKLVEDKATLKERLNSKDKIIKLMKKEIIKYQGFLPENIALEM